MKQRFTKLLAALALLVFMMPSVAGWGQQEVTLWSEDFSSYSANDVPKGGTYSYACTNGTGNSAGTTKIYNENTGGGTAPELLIGKPGTGTGAVGGSFTAVIPLDNIEGTLTLTYYQNKQKLSVSSTTTGVSGGQDIKPTEVGQQTTTFTGITSSMESITIVFQATTNNNVRLDNIVLTGTQAGGTPTPSVSLLTDPISVTSTGGQGNLDITYSNLEISSYENFDCVFYDEDGDVLTGSDIPTWVGQTFSGNSTNGYKFNYNIGAYTGATDRVARLKVYAVSDDLEDEAYSDLLVITQTAKHTVTFSLAGGTFVPNDDFASESVEKETGSYHLPSATKQGWRFVGWYDGANTYAANAEYTVSADVEFTAQWSNTVTATYTITSTSAVAPSGTVPTSSSATFSNTYTNNKYQLTNGNSMTLTLSGYEGLVIKSITLSMHSNNSSGAGTFSAVAGSTTIASISPAADFNSNSWNGSWSNPDFVDVFPPMTNSNYTIKSGEEVVITIAATVNSLFCQSFTIEYAASTDPIVNVTPAMREVDYNAHNSASENMNFTISSNNITSPSYTLCYCDENGTVLSTNPYDWFAATLSGTTVSFTTTANTGEDRMAYFVVYAMVDSEPVYSGVCSVKQDHESHIYTLVTSIDQIVTGKHYILASSRIAGDAYAMGSQSGNVREAVGVTITETSGVVSIAEVDDLREFVISGSSSNNWTIYDSKHPGFLYPSNSGNNYIGTRVENSDGDSQWQVSFGSNYDNCDAVFMAQGDNDRKTIRYNYNNGSPRFSCYKTDSSIENYVYLYVKNNDNDCHVYSATTLNDNTSVSGNMNIHEGVVTISAGKILTVNGALTNTIATNLIIEDGGQLIASNDVKGTMQKTIVGYSDTNPGWYFISSPLTTNVNVTDVENLINANGSGYDLYYFKQNPTINNGVGLEWINQKNSAANFTKLFQGSGYLYANATNTTLSFAGTLRKSSPDYEQSISYIDTNPEEDMRGWNLVGNPFPATAYIIAEDVDFYVLGVNNGQMDVIAAVGNSVAPMEGVFAHTTTNKSMTFTTTEPDPESNGDAKVVLNLNRGRGVIDRAIVRFAENRQLPKFQLSENSTKLYIPQNDKDYAVVSSEAQGEMPVNFKAQENGTYTLNIDTENVEMNYLHLIDNMTGMDVDLLQTPSYTFDATTNDYASRFRLVFSANNVDGPSAGSETFAFYSNGNWVVNNEGEATLQVIDVNGRIVSNETINGTVATSINATPGVYMLRLVNGNEVKTQKIVVK